MKKFLVIALVAALASLTGCATTLASSTNGKLAYAEVKGTDKGTFEASQRGVYLFGFLGVNKPQEKIDTFVQPALDSKGANAAKDLKVVWHADFLGAIVSSVTFGLIQLPNIVVSGTAVAQ